MYEIGPQLATSGATGRRAERAGSRLQPTTRCDWLNRLAIIHGNRFRPIVAE
ncbi:hypothetical protein F441_16917 [Phytophthora nicotianae CJ01A1]|uniref:Uncharacterized protein n=3 Tax=Phytophthora nicotianae TaxID=4792 RepID=V9ECV3_PHYNI|nr:hypothetical protein F443_17058 [Phytophthora nicotianae P1569]ETO65670.1 hypothetical protein F444_17090 [Phytophthora nicotianae P1976]ETP06785.1 hypothetical protein F441_16917 [Phytophthora nicotianae CJ01A1]